MFDEMIIRTAFMRGLISKKIGDAFQQKTGLRTKLNLEKLEVHTIEDEICLKLNGSVRMPLSDFKKLVEGGG